MRYSTASRRPATSVPGDGRHGPFRFDEHREVMVSGVAANGKRPEKPKAKAGGNMKTCSLNLGRLLELTYMDLGMFWVCSWCALV